MLIKSLKILDTTKIDIFELKVSQGDRKSDRTTVVHISAVFGTL